MEVKSKLIQCPNGHYYNGALHNQCPVCTSGSRNFATTGDFGNYATSRPGGTQAVGSTVPAGTQAVGSTVPAGTQPIGSTVPAGTQPVGSTMPAGGYGYYSVGGTEPPYVTMPPDAPVPNAVGSTIIGEDVDPGNGGNGTRSRRTNLVVGWLVCIEGEARGLAFDIHTGYNYIGRESGDILVPGDMQISRQNHAMVAYDPTDHIYYVGPSAGRNLIKVNGRTIFNAAEIKSYDVISIGSTKLMFMGLCGDRFNWSQGRLYG